MALRTKKRMASVADDAQRSVQPSAEVALGKLGTAIDDARAKAKPVVEDARSKVGPALEDARGQVGPAWEQARDKVGPALEDARDRMSPALEQARDKVSPALEQARDTVSPALEGAVAGGKRRGRKAAAKLDLAEEPKKKGHKLRNLLILLGLGGLAAAVYKQFFGGADDPAWTSTRDDAAVHHTSPVSAPTTSATAATAEEGEAGDKAGEPKDADG
ncbi:MAG: hypothetical protein ACRDQA_18155 [Nocardioidaceae bacterium]